MLCVWYKVLLKDVSTTHITLLQTYTLPISFTLLNIPNCASKNIYTLRTEFTDIVVRSISIHIRFKVIRDSHTFCT